MIGIGEGRCDLRIDRLVVITFCRKPELFYGTSLVFATLRVGFPNAHVTVVDNGSIAWAVPRIKELAETVSGEFLHLEELPHAEIIKELILKQRHPFVILDPDIVFWDRMDGCDDALLSGRLIPEFADPYTGCLTHPRLHTSFLKINDPKALQDIYRTTRTEKFEWEPFHPLMYETPSGWRRYDTLASFYASIRDRCHAFTDDELDSYDHLFCGSHMDVVIPRLGFAKPEVLLWMLDIHNRVKGGDTNALRGAWKEQDRFFALHSGDLTKGVRAARSV